MFSHLFFFLALFSSCADLGTLSLGFIPGINTEGSGLEFYEFFFMPVMYIGLKLKVATNLGKTVFPHELA